jgi:hypothetical protein
MRGIGIGAYGGNIYTWNVDFMEDSQSGMFTQIDTVSTYMSALGLLKMQIDITQEPDGDGVYETSGNLSVSWDGTVKTDHEAFSWGEGIGVGPFATFVYSDNSTQCTLLLQRYSLLARSLDTYNPSDLIG